MTASDAGIVVQARMGSSRLPGKVAAPIGGRPALVLQLERLVRTGLPVVVATSHLDRDDEVVALADAAGVPAVRGPELDVLGRFVVAAAELGTRHVVRLTGDCPLTDPDLVLEVVDLHRSAAADYTTNVLPRTYPKGLDVEVLTAAALREADAEATERPDREHVTPFVYRRPGRFRLANLAGPVDRSHERWTLDTADDLQVIRGLVDGLDAVTVSLEELTARRGAAPPLGPGGLVARAATSADAHRLGAPPSSAPGDDPWVRSWVLERAGTAVAWATASTGSTPGPGRREVVVLEHAAADEAAAWAALDALLEGDQQLRP